MNTTIGTCSVCGGPVQVPSVWCGINPPVPTCSRCGAVKKQTYGPIIDMQPVTHPHDGTIQPHPIKGWEVT